MKRLILNRLAASYQKIRVSLFKRLSSNSIIGTPYIMQPALFIGKGVIKFGDRVQIGYFPSPYFFSGNAHFEARKENSNITIGNNVYFNNGVVLISEKSIKIGNDILVGTNVEIYDSDFHNTNPDLRFGGHEYEKESVIIEDNVWLGSNVKILKGVTIGKNSVISNGAIVTKSIPPNTIAGGIPAKVIKSLPNE